jgi:Putative zinc-finger
MAELTCEETQEAAVEFALGILPAARCTQVAAHVLACPRCQQEVAALRDVASRLLDLIPGTEPPLGFDRSVLLSTAPQRHRILPVKMLVGTAVGLVLTAILLGVPHRSHQATTPRGAAAVFRDNGVPVGSLAAGGRPIWVSVSVRGVAISGPVSCELIGRTGSVETLGLFDLVHGNGSWAAPDPAGLGGDRQARLVDQKGRVIAVADLR